MKMTQAQLKGKIKSLAKSNHADARILMRIYMMERFLERVANSPYADNIIIKGGMLVTAMLGVAMRSTMDIDTSIRNINLSKEVILQVVRQISEIDLGDDVSFVIKDLDQIMDEMEYPGIRITMDAIMGELVTPIKIDVSTGDAITPRAIVFNYKLMLEDRNINLYSYNLETILAEKLQTVLTRGVINTRMRDFYDIYSLMLAYENIIDRTILREAFRETCQKRETPDVMSSGKQILSVVANDENLAALWKSYQKKYSYAAEITYEKVVGSTRLLFSLI